MHPFRSIYLIWARFVTVVFIGVLCFIAVSTTHMAYAGEPAKQDAVRLRLRQSAFHRPIWMPTSFLRRLIRIFLVTLIALTSQE